MLVNRLLPFYDPKEADPDGWTALMFAASLGQREVVECLLPVSDVNAKNNRGFCAARIANGSLRQMIEAFALAQSERAALVSEVGDSRGYGSSGRL